jgi:hypothetical protein
MRVHRLALSRAANESGRWRTDAGAWNESVAAVAHSRWTRALYGAPMTVEVLTCDDAGHERWLATHPDGFILNARRLAKGPRLASTAQARVPPATASA